jgi:rfaE bifunctional protein kinase chain/domain/rfaE bifunctional protein nucleotidyltransferase chain/domain
MIDPKNKIFSIEALASKATELKKNKQKIILCHGTFDLIHGGHIKYLQKAKSKGDLLFVTVTADEYVNKGPGRPVFNDSLRAENLAALACVDFVGINYELTAVNMLKKICPDLYVKGSEYQKPEEDVTGNIQKEIDAVREGGGDIFYTNEITFSSSSLINDHFDVFAPETKAFLSEFKQKYSDKEIQDQIGSLSDLNVLVIGDIIIDQYHYVSPLGQTGKGNVLAVQYESEEQFAGGSIAVANHTAQFVNNVTLLSALGDRDSHEDYIRSKLEKNITPFFTYFKDAPTLTKRRFVDSDLTKLFEVYFYQDEPTFKDDGKFVEKWLHDHLAEFDLVLVADFGNGFISPNMREIICSKAKFLAINTQINSGNRGYHVITNYKKANYISLNEPEIRLATHNRHDSLEHVAAEITKKLGVKQCAVTRGTKGVVMLDSDKKSFYRVPALSSRVVDRIGAGDAFLSLSSICLAGGLDSQIANFVGSVAAAMDVQIVCNREPINSVSLKKYISTLLK